MTTTTLRANGQRRSPLRILLGVAVCLSALSSQTAGAQCTRENLSRLVDDFLSALSIPVPAAPDAPGIVAQAVRTRQPVIINDIRRNAQVASGPALLERGFLAAATAAGLADSFSRAGAAAFLGAAAFAAGFFAGVGCFLLEAVEGFVGLRAVMARRAKAAFDPPM